MTGDSLYARSTGPLFRLLKTPTEPPEAPAGSHDSVLVMRASEKFVKYRLVLLVIGAGLLGLCGLGLVVASAVVGESELLILGALLLLAAALAVLIGWFAIRIDYQLRYYILTDRSLRVRAGALVVREQTLTYANVQNLDLKQGPIQRWLGIADLHVETAGGGSGGQGEQHARNSHEAVIAGVENAREIREQIRARLDGLQDAGLGDPDDRSARGARGVAPGLDSQAARAALRGLVDEARALRAVAEAGA